VTAAAPVRTQRPLFEPLRRRAGADEPALANRAHRPGPDGDGLTLEQQLDRVWEGLLAAGTAECPVCGARIERIGAEARCDGCESTLE
jgi:hypothetical protein